MPCATMDTKSENEKRLPAKKEMDSPSSTNSSEVHNDFSFRLLTAIAIKGVKPKNANNGKDDIIQPRLNRMVPPAKR